MASFLNWTYESSKTKGKMGVSEKKAADVMFVSKQGERRPAKLMFFSGRVVEEPNSSSWFPIAKTDKNAPLIGRRELLVQTALEERTFFSRAIVNNLWANFLGRGLVQPLDQMHLANPPV